VKELKDNELVVVRAARDGPVESGEGIERLHRGVGQNLESHVESGEGIESDLFVAPQSLSNPRVESGEGIES